MIIIIMIMCDTACCNPECDDNKFGQNWSNICRGL